MERLQATPIWEINPHRTRRYDYAFVESARREIQHADHIPSLEEVRSILSRIPGSLAADIGEQREDRF